MSSKSNTSLQAALIGSMLAVIIFSNIEWIWLTAGFAIVFFLFTLLAVLSMSSIGKEQEDFCAAFSYSKEMFEELSIPILAELAKAGLVKHEIIGIAGRYESYFEGSARDGSCVVNWRLQDDGGDPYVVFDIYKMLPLTNDGRDGLMKFGVVYCYPHMISNIVNLVTLVRKTPFPEVSALGKSCFTQSQKPLSMTTVV